MGTGFAQFADARYLNLESYRRDGSPVKTPLWFAEHNGALYAYTLADAAKVKRIRRNSKVRVVPSDIRGNPRGDWVEAHASIVSGDEERLGHELLRRKYFFKRVGDWFNVVRRKQHAVIAIRTD
jgi:uncharacterized protein